MIPAVGYLRMSSDAQTESIATQRTAVIAYAKLKGFRIIRWYVDEGISGDSTDKRIEFRRMLADAPRGDFSVILCWDQDRFGRFDLLEAGYWITPLRNAKVRLSTVAQGDIDWNDLAGRLVYGIQQEAKNSFLRDLSRNVNRGHLAAAQAGKWMGTPPYGYAVNRETRRLVVSEPRASTVRFIFLRAATQSVSAVQRELQRLGHPAPQGETWHRRTIIALLKNIAYRGHTRRNYTSEAKYTQLVGGVIVPSLQPGGGRRINDKSAWTVVENTHEPLVTQAQFDAAQGCRGRAFLFNGRPATHPILFRKLLYCGHCGSLMSGSYVPKMGDVMYVCGAYVGGRECVPNRTYESPLLAEVRAKIRDQLLDPGTIAAARAAAEQQLRATATAPSTAADKRRLATICAKLTKAEQRLLELPHDMVQIVIQQIRTLRDQHATLSASIAESSRPLPDRADDLVSQLDLGIERLRAVLSAGESSEELAALLRDSLERVTVTSCKMSSGSPRGKWLIQSVDIR